MGKEKRKRTYSSSSSSSDEVTDLRREVRKLRKKLRRKDKRRRHSTDSSLEPTEPTILDSSEIDEKENEDPRNENSEVDPLKIEFVDVPTLNESVLCVLGEDNPSENIPEIILHEDLVSRWENILKKGLKDTIKINLLEKYPSVKNCPFISPPKLNPEVSAAVNESALKRDERLKSLQRQLGASLGAIGKALTILLNREEKEKGGDNLPVIETLSDAARLLADLHFEDSESRRGLVSVSLNKDLKDTLSSAVVDGWLFGDNLSERVKAAKAIERSGLELKQRTQPQKFRSSNLGNSRGPLRKNVRLSGQKYHTPRQGTSRMETNRQNKRYQTPSYRQRVQVREERRKPRH